MNYEKNKKYFAGSGLLIYLIVWFFFSSGLVAFTETAFTRVLAILICIAALVGIIVFVIKSKVTDEQYDSAVKEEMQEMKQRALDKLGVDIDEVKEIEPIVIGGYNYNEYTLCKKGKDGVWRTNMYKVIYLFFSQNEVHSYTCEFCTTAEQKNESTDVYFYQDIVSASTESSTATFKKEKVQYESFKLTTSGGTSLLVAIRDSNHAQRSISAMRQLLRAKKVSQ